MEELSGLHNCCWINISVVIAVKGPNDPIHIVYVPSHLYHMLFELFKVLESLYCGYSPHTIIVLYKHKSKNSVIIYSPSCRSKSVWLSFFSRTQNERFYEM